MHMGKESKMIIKPMHDLILTKRSHVFSLSCVYYSQIGETLIIKFWLFYFQGDLQASPPEW